VVRANRCGFGIGEQGKINLAPIGKKLQDFRRIVTDGRKLDALLFESGSRVLQLDQLPFAVGSPICGAEE
jgi:hypothetical protein